MHWVKIPAALITLQFRCADSIDCIGHQLSELTVPNLNYKAPALTRLESSTPGLEIHVISVVTDSFLTPIDSFIGH